MAGINAHQKAVDKQPLILKRSEAYIGVLVDDLISKGTQEPYRMFTSRAEFRTLLRQDNADLRLTEISNKLGLAKDERLASVNQKRSGVDRIKKIINELSVNPDDINDFLSATGSTEISQKQKLAQILLRPGIGLDKLADALPVLSSALQLFTKETIEQAEIQVKYEVYIEKEKELVGRMNQMEELEIPTLFDYGKVQAISSEAREKLGKIKPRTLGQASRISGINPSDVQILMVYMGR
jgi:tRNA uridine 5-carboxymethylaminomethyl modification enzyme